MILQNSHHLNKNLVKDAATRQTKVFRVAANYLFT